MADKLNPLFKWSGGKRREIKLFKHHYPENFKVFVEPFVGAGAVFFDLNFQGQNFIADMHDEVVIFYKQFSDREKIEKMIEFMDNPWIHILKSNIAKENQSDIYANLPPEFQRTGEATYYYVRDGMKITNDFKKACRFHFLRKTAYRGMLRYNPKGEFNIPWGKYKNLNYDELKDERYTDLLKRTTIRQWSFEKTMKKFKNREDAFVFLDPPYDSEFSDYKTPFNKGHHKELSELFKESKAKCLLVIGDTPYIRELYDGYIVDEYSKNYAFRIHSDRINADDIDNLHLVIKNY
jgi:DNA adenine methylase|tara:strand:- start:153 stop:1031 length:879 start_codon:yes stop_codon:yes gene_type:complete